VESEFVVVEDEPLSLQAAKQNIAAAPIKINCFFMI
jgi:hypothetical protein